MMESARKKNQLSVTGLVGETFSTLERLLRQEFELFRAQFKEDWPVLSIAAFILGLTCLAFLGLAFLGLGLALGVASLGIPLWAGSLAAGLVFILAAIIVYFTMRSKHETALG